ncbi:hypothetical protein SAMN05444401_0975 [Clostridium amylolyticum]|uniref:Uncharacterized protein n=1 Tax=Clostridium amylolyticum TaxID=1121298 RepID=A0A1M6C2T8_9CLOT|nr:hypothetical protein SAMN05444401_0975 [Clostridium amylolyticum]
MLDYRYAPRVCYMEFVMLYKMDIVLSKVIRQYPF